MNTFRILYDGVIFCVKFFFHFPESHVKFSFGNKLLLQFMTDVLCVNNKPDRQNIFSKCEIFSGLERDVGARQCRRRRRGPPVTNPGPGHIGGQAGGQDRD